MKIKRYETWEDLEQDLLQMRDKKMRVTTIHWLFEGNITMKKTDILKMAGLIAGVCLVGGFVLGGLI